MEGAVSLPYIWLQGEFDSFSSVTLKVSFSTPGCYHPDGFKPPPGGRGKKGTGESHKAQSRDAFGWRQKLHIACAQTLADAVLHTALINTKKKKKRAHCSTCVIQESFVD